MAEVEKTALVEAKNDLSVSNIEVTGYDIKSMIYVVRNQQVMLNSDLAMLSAVLRSDVAIQVSINIMNAFVEMRRFISNNALLFERISNVELKQLEYKRQRHIDCQQINENDYRPYQIANQVR